MTVLDILAEIRALSLEERKQLMKLMVDTLDETPQKQYSIMELRGLGKEIWEGIDAQKYIDEMRDEWDQPH